MARAAPRRSHAAHFSPVPAVAYTVAPNARPSMIAVVPMPLAPPWTSIVSPAWSRPRSNTFVHTVKNVSGMAAASLMLSPRGHGKTLHGRRGAVFRVPAARDERAHCVSSLPVGHTRPHGRDGPCHLEPRRVRSTGRWGVSALSLHEIGTVHTRGRHADQHVARADPGHRMRSRLQHVWTARRGDRDCRHRGGHGSGHWYRLPIVGIRYSANARCRS